MSKSGEVTRRKARPPLWGMCDALLRNLPDVPGPGLGKGEGWRIMNPRLNSVTLRPPGDGCPRAKAVKEAKHKPFQYLSSVTRVCTHTHTHNV